MNPNLKTLFVIVIFSIAMAALESAVVVYLRALYYPDGFTVALRMIDQKILLIEIAREFATLFMLAGVGWLAGNNFKDRFAYFLLSFAVWDIFYYVWLKVFIDWPSSLLEWDILFLIPITWLGPVLAPVICSVTMILLSILIIRSSRPLTPGLWGLLVCGSMVILYTFLKDYGSIIIDNGFHEDYAMIMQNKAFVAIASAYIPQSYSWEFFVFGEVLILGGAAMLIVNNYKLVTDAGQGHGSRN
jgi:hypothetical protein